MNNNHTAGQFSLELSKTKTVLSYKGKEFITNCDDLIALTLELGADDTTRVDRFDLSEDEVEWLVKMLNKHVLNGDLCVRK